MDSCYGNNPKLGFSETSRMDIKVWEKTLVAWLNSLSSSSSVNNIKEIDDCLLMDVVKKINCNHECNLTELLKEKFPNLTEGDELKPATTIDYLCSSTLLLTYVSLTEKTGLKDIKDLMCTKLDNITQLNIVQFLMDLQGFEDVFNFSYKQIKDEIFPQIFSNFIEIHCKNNSLLGDYTKTPVKCDLSSTAHDSPLQGFFQTPQRNNMLKQKNSFYNFNGDGDHLKQIKKLSDQLVEEELEKATLHEKLSIQTKKCTEYEAKLKNKIEEINYLKQEWENESKKNEQEINTLKSSIMRKLECEKRLRSELKNLESYVSTLESDIYDCSLKNDKLESQLQESLEKLTASELQIKETSELCMKLQSTIEEKENEMEQFKENYANFFCDEKTIDLSFMNKSLDRSVSSPENLGVVVDKLLKEKIEENASLQETIAELKMEKNCLVDKLNSLNKELAQKCSVVSELQFLKKELNAKVENLGKTEEELFKVQRELLNANAEISKLGKENSHVVEKYNILNNRLQEREQVLINCKNSKALLQINFLKLAEDFKAVQQRLELEVKNISKLALSKGEETPTPETDEYSVAINENVDVKNSVLIKSLSDAEFDVKGLRTKDEQCALYSSNFSSDKICKLVELLQNFDNEIEWLESKASLQKTCSQLNDNIIVLKAKIRDLERSQKNSLDKKFILEKYLKEAQDNITGIKAENFFEINKLKEELEKKENKIKEFENLMAQSRKIQEKLLLEAGAIQKEAKVYKEKRAQIIHEAGDHKSISSAALDNASFGNIEKLETSCERQEFSDSLEEVPVTSKTFDIVNLEDKHISDRTFSIKKESSEACTKDTKSDSAWIISPPSKVPVKMPSKEEIKSLANRRCQGETWVIPPDSVGSKEKIKKISSSVNDLRLKTEDMRFSELQKEVTEFSKECERLKSLLLDIEQKRNKDKDNYEKNLEIIRTNITAKYESQLEHLKTEMKQLYNRELGKHKQEQSTLSSELRDQNKRYKEHIDELRNQLWDLRDKLLQEQTLRRDLERNYTELKEKYENRIFSKEPELVNDVPGNKDFTVIENVRPSALRQFPNVTFPMIPTEDEEEVFDNRFLEDMKTGASKMERPEERLRELQYRNSLCLPHLKSSYPGETQFHNPTLFKETDLKFGLMQFPQESQSLTDSDHSMTKSLLPDNKGKKKDQTSYKRPGPPTPSKNGGRLSVQSGDVRLTPRSVLKELNDQNERTKGTPNPLKLLLSSRNVKNGNVGVKDENTGPVTPRKKKFFRKPFGARDH